MKRSRYVAVLWLGVTPFALTACDKPKAPVGVYRSEQECVADDKFSADRCHGEWLAAMRGGQTDAPRYVTREDCEAEFEAEQCGTVQTPGYGGGGGGAFVYYSPRPVGYAVSGSSGATAWSSRPLFAPRSGDLAGRMVTPEGAAFSGTGFRMAPAWKTASPRAGAVEVGTPIARGGFGARAAAFASE